MIEFQAPYSSPITIIDLPNPELQDSRRILATVLYYEAMDGTQHSYKRHSRLEELQLRFINISWDKRIEVEQFIRGFAGEDWRYVDGDNIWKVKLVNNPFRSTNEGRKEPSSSTIKEHTVLDFTLIGEKL